jgi:acetyl-CoA acyltransferase
VPHRESGSPSSPDEPVIVEAVRTPIGKRGRALAGVRPDDLVAYLAAETLRRAGAPAEALGDLIVGCATPTGEQGWNIARQAVLLAGFPVEVPGVTVNRMCASSDQAVRYAAHAIRMAEIDVALAMGVESMSRVPMASDGESFSPSMSARFTLIQQGLSAELVAEKWGLSRAALEELAVASHRHAVATWASGGFADEVVPVEIDAVDGSPVTLDRDEGPRADTSLEQLAGLPPAFQPDGRITAGTSSQMSDGASAVLLASRRRAAELGLRPRARIVAGVTVGSDPVLQLAGVIEATGKALERSGLQVGDIDHFEVNEAFASVPLAWLAETGAPPERLNPRGGAIALGHPLGATGGRLLVTMLHALEQTGGRLGLQTMCIGHGMANATIIERIVD